MNDLPQWVADIEIRANARPVLLVEGPSDVGALEHFLSLYDPGWDQWLYLAAAGNKQKVIQGVSVHCPGWVGIIDRDEWSPEAVQAAGEQTERLKILPRFCIESYFCVPGELWSALPEKSRKNVHDDVAQLSEPILKALPDWVAHGAMWRVLHARYRGLRSTLGFPAKLENQPVTDLGEIRAILQTWHDCLKPDDILDAYQDELHTAQKLPTEELLKSYVHGKKFFNQVVVQCLGSLFPGQGRDYWLKKFRDDQIQPPPDLVALFKEILGLIERPPHHGGKT